MKKLYIIAGEPSGDFLGAKVISRIKAMRNAQIFGTGGALMQKSGLKSIIDIQQLSVVGILEIVPHLFKINRLINRVVADILKTNPAVLLTIDSPGFCFRVAKLVRKKNPNIKLIHLVAPSVWAWRERRAKKVAKLYDHLLTLFDFEPQYFSKYGLKTTFVGHPAIEEFDESKAPKENMLLILPGSRKQEIKVLLPIFLKSLPSLNFKRIVIPTLPHLVKFIRTITSDENIEIISEEEQRLELFQNAKCAMVASGTVTLQLALSGCPMVCCYRISSLTYRIVKAMVKVKHISLVNIILNRSVIPELIQNECNPTKIAKCINSINYDAQMSAFRDIKSHIQYGDIIPSKKIAEIIASNLC